MHEWLQLGFSNFSFHWRPAAKYFESYHKPKANGQEKYRKPSIKNGLMLSSRQHLYNWTAVSVSLLCSIWIDRSNDKVTEIVTNLVVKYGQLSKLHF